MDISSHTEHTATVHPISQDVATVTCTCGWVASGGAMLSTAGAERIAAIHTA